MTSVAEAFQAGTQLHQAGRLAEAEQIYRQILTLDPDHPPTLHQYGLLAAQGNQFEVALELFLRAVLADRTQPAFHANLGEAYRHLGRVGEAEISFRQALKLEPRTPRVRTLLARLLHDAGRSAEAVAELREELRLQPENGLARGQLAHVLWDQGRWDEAEACLRRLVRSEPRNVEAHCRLGGVLQQQGKSDAAALSYRAALELDPQQCTALNNLGTLLKDQGRLAEAADCFRRATTANPRYAPAHLNLGLLLESQRQLAAALDSYRAAAACDPQSTLACYSMGAVLQQQEKYADAVPWYEATLRIDPQHEAARLSLGYLLKLLGQLERAIEHWQLALARNPNCADAHNNLAVAWNELGNRQASIEHCQRALALRPDLGPAHVNLVIALLGAGELDRAVAAGQRAIGLADKPSQAHGNLANSYQTRGQLDEAVAEHRQAIALDPTDAPQHSNLLYTLNYHPGFSLQQLADEHRAWGARHADPWTAGASAHVNVRDPARRLRVGYVSGHFRAHAVNAFAEPILASHDHLAYEVFCYANNVIRDATTDRLRAFADHWRDISGLDDAAASALVRSDQIDVLVDLAGHIGGNRLGVFARKPAPVQVTYLGYQNTTGMTGMDYRLTDAYADPPGETDAYYTERLMRLPRTFFVYLPSAAAPAVGELPAIDRGYVTFGTFNHFAKVNRRVLETWSQLLAAVPRSRLLILSHESRWIRDVVDDVFARAGVSVDRVELVPRRPVRQYLELIAQVDLALDTFPFNGHTTTCDCLWQGVPVVALAGNSYVSRFGSSGLATLGLDRLVADSVEQYIAKAAGLAGDPQCLRELRCSLRDRMQASALMDYPGFTRDLEAAYRQMWRTWCQSVPATVAGEVSSPRRG